MNDKASQKTEKGLEPRATRRWLFRRMAALGLLAGAGPLARVVRAQAPPQPVQLPKAPELPKLELQPLAVEQFKAAFVELRRKKLDLAPPTAAWRESLSKLSPTNRVAAVMVAELTRQNPKCQDIGAKAAQIAHVTSASPELSDFAKSSAWGGICGGDCRDASGVACGVRCSAVVDQQYAIDPEGKILESEDFSKAKVNLGDFSVAIHNATVAYREVTKIEYHMLTPPTIMPIDQEPPPC